MRWLWVASALIGLTDLGCQPPPPELEAELLGWRLVERMADSTERQVFDVDRLPVVRTASDAGTLTLALNGQVLRTTATTRGGYRLYRVDHRREWPMGVAVLTAEAPGRSPMAWTVRLDTPPEALPQIAPAVGHRLAGRPDEALKHLDSLSEASRWPARLWVGVERARALAQSGRTDAAIDAWVRAAEEAAGVPTEVARRLRAAAWLANDSRRIVRAAELLDRARAVTPDDPTSQALQIYLDGVFANRLRDLAAAGRHFEDAQTRFSALGLDRQADQASEALAINAALVGDLEHALALYAELSTRVAVDDTAARQRLALHHGLALAAAMEAGRVASDRAPLEALFETARALAAAEGRPDDLANVETHRADIALMFGDLDAAEERLGVARGLIDDQPGLASTWVDLLEAQVMQRRTSPGAAAAFETVEALAELRGEDEVRWMARLGRARADRDAGRVQSALNHYADARAIVAEVGRRAALRQGRVGFHARRSAPAHEAVELLVEQGRTAEAFALADSERARLLRDARRALRIARLDPASRAVWTGHMQAIEQATAARPRLLAREKTIPLDQRAAWRKAIAAVDRKRFAAYDAALAHIEAAMPDTAAPAVDVAAARDRLPEGAALLTFGPSRSGWRAFWLDSRRLETMSAGDDPFWPWRSRIRDVTRLFIVPGGHPRVLAAAVEGPEPLAADVPVAWLPYAGALSTGPLPDGAALVVADTRMDLPHARAEGASVARRWPDTLLLMGDSARRSAVLDALPSARVLHFAGHGVLRPGQPWAAHLALAGRDRLDLLDVLGRPLRASVVVLSGCETGTDGPLLDDRVLGLPEAFLAAGVRGVVATDRPISDVAARRFAEAFYSASGDRDPVAAAHTAALRLRAEGIADWSAFRVIGGW
ncbi:MAG: CHAT domain-containing protein [Myxococcales bacterium]|nr:CHAT domain-containing protein [Myxococcales bacterium]